MTKYVYGLVDADTLELRYIGQTIKLARRRGVHAQRHPDLRMVTLERNPLDLGAAERRWIQDAKAQGARLLNQRNGGNGVVSDETRAKLSASHTGKIYKKSKGHRLSAETRAKISAAMRGKQNALGRVVSLETRAKISAELVGNTNRLGHKHSEESKTKMRGARS